MVCLEKKSPMYKWGMEHLSLVRSALKFGDIMSGNKVFYSCSQLLTRVLLDIFCLGKKKDENWDKNIFGLVSYKPFYKFYKWALHYESSWPGQ